MTLFEHAKRTTGDRKVTYSFDGPAVGDDGIGPDNDGWSHRIDVHLRHDKDSRRYVADIYKVEARSDRGYTVTRFAPLSGLSVRVHAAQVARHSDARFLAFCDEAVTMCEALVNHGDADTSLATRLLREAQGYAAVKN